MAVAPRIRVLARFASLLVVPALVACTSSGTAAGPAADSSTTASAVLTAATSSAPSAVPTATSPTPSSSSSPAPQTAPQAGSYAYDHVVVVVLENHASGQIVGSTDAPYLNALAKRGLVLADSHGETHPSEPNYLALFAGQTFGVSSDACPLRLSGPNLASELRAAKLSFATYSEGLPHAGYTGCSYATPTGYYARKHNPMVNFTNVPASWNKPFSAFPKNLAALPTVSFVVPNLGNDMHDGTIRQSDSWLRANVGRYATWARTHRSLLIVTWDEDNGTSANHIATFVVGDGVRVGTVSRRVNHYTLLRTIEDVYRLPRLGQSGAQKPIAVD